MKGYSKNHHAHIVQLNGHELEHAIEVVEKHVFLSHSSERCNAQKHIYSSLKIKQAKEISAAAKNKNTEDERRIFLIGFNAITREAQNALLKTLEEPPSGTSFVLLVPTSDILLKTIQSRCISITLELLPTTGTSFLKASHKERLEQIKLLLENKDLLGHFYAALEWEINEHLSSFGNTQRDAKSLSLVFAYKHLLMEHSTSSKYLLEEIALRLPVISE
ncbi:MAG: hypothetical protein WDZ75_01900 [Candidatus Paceibacterota bacterium]